MTPKQRVNAVRRARTHLLRTKIGGREFAESGQGSEWKLALKHLDDLERDLLKDIAPPWTKIGPVLFGDKSLLDYALTHATSGIPLFPAVDLAWGSNVAMYAPENCVVDTKDTSANPGEALYLTGESGIQYWWGHGDRDYPLGKRFRKGELVWKTAWQPNKKAHGHIGVNVEALLGKGKQLKYGRTGEGPNYTHGSPTIREQLRALL